MEHNQEIKSGLSRREILKYGLYGSLGVGAGLSSSLWLGGCGSWPLRKRPNVLVIVLDTARADRFSFMGYGRNTTPNIDTMALEGAIYERAYAPACWTLPSHASLFTGLYPLQAGATSETLQLPPANTTLAKVLKKAGYNTIAFSCNPWVSIERGFGRGFDQFHEMWRFANRPKNNLTEQPEPVTVKKVDSWLKERKDKEPFFAFINLNNIHLPYIPSEPFLSGFVGGRGYNNEEVNRVAAITAMWGHLGGELQLSQRDFRIMSDLYDGEVALADHFVGQITEQLRHSGVLDDTLVIITSDHGEHLGEHGRIDHNLSMHETALHIPLIIRYPERFKEGGRIKDLVSLMDITPTILDVCDVREGTDQVKPVEMSLARDDRIRRKFIVAGNERPLTGVALMKKRYPKFDVGSIDHRLRAIRTDRHKLIWTIGQGWKLFNLENDPGEINDLSKIEIDIRENLHKILINWFNQLPSAKDSSLLKSQDEESLKMLRSLGYIE